MGVTSGSHPGKVLAVGSVEIGNLAIDSSAGQLATFTQNTGTKFEAGIIVITTGSSGSAELEVPLQADALTLKSATGSTSAGSPKLNTNSVSIKIGGDLRLLKEGSGNPVLNLGSGNIDVSGDLQLTGVGTSLQLQSGSELVLDGIQNQEIDLANVDLQSSNVRLRISNNETESGQALATITLPDNFQVGGGLTIDKYARATITSEDNDNNDRYALTINKIVNVNGKIETADTNLDFLDSESEGVKIGPFGEISATGSATVRLPKGQLDNSAGGMIDLSAASTLEIGQNAEVETNDNHLVATSLGMVIGNYDRQFTGTGTVRLRQGLKDNFPTPPSTPISISAGSNVEMVLGEDSLLSTQHANVSFNGQVTLGKGTDIELWAGRPITFGPLKTQGNGDVNFHGKGSASDGVSKLIVNGERTKRGKRKK